MWFQKFRLQDHSIKTQLTFGFLMVLVPLLTILVVASYFYSADIVAEKTLEQFGETVEQFSMSLDHFMEQNINKLEMIGDNPTVQEELNAAVVNLEEDGSFYSRNKQIRRIMVKEFSSVTMNDMELYGKNGASYYISVWSQKYEIPGEMELFRKADEAKGRWILVQNEENAETLQMIKLIKDLQTYRPIGYIRIGLKRSYIDKLADAIHFNSQGRIFVLDGHVPITSTEESSLLLKKMEQETKGKGNFQYEEDEQAYQAHYVHSNVTGWESVGLIPMSYLKRDLVELRNVSFIFVFLSLSIGILVLWRIADHLVGPIKETESALEQFAKGDFTVRLSENRKDEIGKMNVVFNQAICDIEDLTQKVTQAGVLTKEMEFKTLQSQMNPHFLYNTLDAINWMAFKEGQSDICDLVTAISNLTRGTISNKQSIITLEQELSYVRDYLYIQKIRYQDRFETIYEIDEALLKQAVPKLVVQPIVENAIVHGIEGANGESCLYITAKREGTDIDITIRDTGVGMSEEKVASLLQEPDEDQVSRERFHTNLGIYAVHKRLQFLYGEAYGLRIQSVEGKGTMVTIHIPYMEDQEQLKKTCGNMWGENNEC